MFGLGILEILIVLALLSWAFRRWIARRWPNTGKAITFVLWFMLAGVVMFDLIAWFSKG